MKPRIKSELNIEDFDYFLPKELIAEKPSFPRDNSSLLVLDRKTEEMKHMKFFNIIEFFNEGDLLLLNKTKVLPARLFGLKETGGFVDILFLKENGSREFYGSTRGKNLHGKKIYIGNFEIQMFKEKENFRFIIEKGGTVNELIDKYGNAPLPPYIKRKPDYRDKKWYQSIFAQIPGSIAAPTASLHFTSSIIKALKNKNVLIEYLLLHIGEGSFKPVKEENIKNCFLRGEYYEISKKTIERIKEVKQKKGRVFACGTTVVRAIESYAIKGELKGLTSLFIFPPFKFKILDCLITNFHLPRSAPFILVSAFVKRDLLLKAYKEAINRKYRFLSYGDAMLII